MTIYSIKKKLFRNEIPLKCTNQQSCVIVLQIDWNNYVTETKFSEVSSIIRKNISWTDFCAILKAGAHKTKLILKHFKYFPSLNVNYNSPQ